MRVNQLIKNLIFNLMKKFLGLLFFAGIIAISACGGAKEEAKTTDSTNVQPTEQVETAPADTTQANPQ